MGEVVPDSAVGVGDDAAVPGGDGVEVQTEQAVERCQVLGHVAVGRADHDRRALHDVVAREQQPLLVEEVAEVVGRVAGRVDGGEGEARTLDTIAVGETTVGLEAVARREPQHLGAGTGLQAGRARGVVGVGVRREDPADAVPATCGDGVEVGGFVGPGVYDRDLVDADEVGVRARPGHHPRVRRQDAAHHRAQRARDPHNEVRGHGFRGRMPAIVPSLQVE